MTDNSTHRLHDCVESYRAQIPALADIALQSTTLDPAVDAEALIALYDRVYPLLEAALWGGKADFHPLLDVYQGLFREQDALIRGSRGDRLRFILSIPVADRPPHLAATLESIHQVCERFGYGGTTDGTYDHIKVVVAEDSRDRDNVRRHLDIIDGYRQKGLQIFHFDQDEQYALLQAIPDEQRALLGNILTTQPRKRFWLKGQAANRNLSYLKMLQLTDDPEKTLYYLIDCDQSLCVNRQTANGDEAVYAISYFHHLEQIFRDTDTLLLTGKLVGDPPVSPSVMAANFLDDVIAFFEELATLPGDAACTFHGLPEQLPGDAAYHDMAKLFGFDNQDASFPYRCQCQGEHDHAACLADLACRLNAFFFGEHLTRRTYFDYGEGLTTLSAARTIYPGNYVVNYAGLKYIIPFGHLRLRMSGPTAGRLIAAEIGARFATCNLPNLHRRTSEEGLADDFRPGVELAEESIDLANEFERQFFGDLMLFSTAELVREADVNAPFPELLLRALVDRKETELLELYQQKHDAILAKADQLSGLVFDAHHWWLGDTRLADSLQQVRTFLKNIERNFGEQSLSYRQIRSAEHRAERKQQIVNALLNYRHERDAWDRLF